MPLACDLPRTSALRSKSHMVSAQLSMRVVPVEVVDAQDAQQRRSGITVIGVVPGIPRRAAKRASGGISTTSCGGARNG